MQMKTQHHNKVSFAVDTTTVDNISGRPTAETDDDNDSTKFVAGKKAKNRRTASRADDKPSRTVVGKETSNRSTNKNTNQGADTNAAFTGHQDTAIGRRAEKEGYLPNGFAASTTRALRTCRRHDINRQEIGANKTDTPDNRSTTSTSIGSTANNSEDSEATRSTVTVSTGSNNSAEAKKSGLKGNGEESIKGHNIGRGGNDPTTRTSDGGQATTNRTVTPDPVVTTATDPGGAASRINHRRLALCDTRIETTPGTHTRRQMDAPF
ncbi:mucin-21-like [Odontomachus brunneus]|uniref:mucin-21-like n=1 Tax=Odontomachus brunneus TaxID=486640 RepID=UPI0013F21172|nr:mucin-21-like [Odontomachus brunneus]